MTPETKARPVRPPRAPRPAGERLTTEDLRHKALAVRDVAAREAKQLVERNTVRIVLGSALVFAVALSAAYYFGSRSGAKAARRKR